MNEKRVRVNAKSTAKGVWTLDVTVEISGEDVSSADVNVLEIIKEKETEFRVDGRKLAVDNDGD